MSLRRRIMDDMIFLNCEFGIKNVHKNSVVENIELESDAPYKL